MSKALVITEKPSVARDIVKVFGGFQEHDGYFESDDYVVTFAVGHLYELLPPEEIDEKYKRWTLDTLPIIPESYRYKAKKGQSERIRTIRKLLERKDVERIVNACDAGREGELIFREIVENLGSDKRVERLWLQSMTDQAIRRGFENLRPGDELQGLASAAACRARSDWLIGMNATRALTKRLKSRKEKTAWSAGRVQTPTLAMLVDREFEILAHVPRPYWRVTGRFVHEGEEYIGAWFDPSFGKSDDAEARDDRIFDEARAEAIAAAVRDQTAVAGETRKPSRESAPPLFDLTSLQREGNRRFGWSARRTLSAAQRCYERHKLLTYPRTDSRCLPNDYRANVNDTLQTFASAGADVGEDFESYAASAERLLRDGLKNEGRVFNDAGVSDHFAIIPTGTLPQEQLSGDDRRVFDLIVRRFLGTFHPPAVWERVERVTEIADEHFRTRARHLKEPGWRAVLDAPTDSEESPLLRPLAPGSDSAEGVAVSCSGSEMSAEETRPSARITEARLLSLMENAGKQIDDDDLAANMQEKGIGTPATRAEIIENLIAKGYIVRQDKALRPTVKGIRLIDTLHRIRVQRLTSPELTGRLENHLVEVERGDRNVQEFMNEIETYAREIVEIAKTFEYDELYDTNESLGPCPSCERKVIEMAWFYRCEPQPDVAQEDDCPMRFWKDTSGRYLDRQSVKALIKDGQTGTLDGFTARNGRTYKGILELDRDEWKLKVQSLGWNEGEGTSADPEYDVNPDPLGPCRCDPPLKVVETPTHFACERKAEADRQANELKLAKRAWKEEGKTPREIRELAAERKAEAPETCGIALPRTVCKREITRDEAQVFLDKGRTELLEDFTSRFGRPFSAILFLKENGRHGFEFPPRKVRGGGDAKETPTRAVAKSAGRKKTTPKKKTATKATRKKTTPKKTTPKKKTATKTARKKKTVRRKAKTAGKGSRGAASAKSPQS